MAFLGVEVPTELAELLSIIDVPGTKENINELHITFLYFTPNALEPKEIGKIIEITNKVISNYKPFFVSFDMIESFPKGNDGYPIIIPINSKEFKKIYYALFKEFEKAKIDFSKKFKIFRPHITLSYNDKPFKKKISELGFTITKFKLKGGAIGEDGITSNIPLNINEASHKYFELIKMSEKIEWLVNQ